MHIRSKVKYPLRINNNKKVDFFFILICNLINGFLFFEKSKLIDKTSKVTDLLRLQF